MNQRGGIAVYVLFSIVVAGAAGFGTYRFLRDHKSSAPDVDEPAATPPAAAAHTPAVVQPAAPLDPVPAPTPDPTETPRSIADENAVDPADNDDFETPSPAFGVAGIDGAIERTSVDRRFRARARLLQGCYDKSGASPGVTRITLAVEPSGKITTVTVGAGLNDSFNTCVTALMNAMSFSGTRDSRKATIVQPVRFH